MGELLPPDESLASAALPPLETDESPRALATIFLSHDLEAIALSPSSSDTSSSESEPSMPSSPESWKSPPYPPPSPINSSSPTLTSSSSNCSSAS